MESLNMNIIQRIAISLGALAAALPVAAQEAQPPFYKGKTIPFIIGFAVNNGYDTYSRLVVRHMARHLSGNPLIVPQNMPGAASIAAINHLYNAATRDGTVLGMVDQSAPLTQLIEPKAFRADVTKFNWIGRITDNSAVLYGWRTAPVQKIEQACEKELIVAAPGQSSRALMTFLQNLLGLNLKILTGYRGPNDSRLAMERGEIHALTQPYSVLRAEKPDWLRDKTVTLLLQVSVDSHNELKHIPIVTGLARTAEERQLIEFIAGNSRIGRAVLSPPGQPPERVADLRRAFMAVMEDQEFLSDIKKLELDLNPMPGEALQKFVEAAVRVSPELVEKAKTLSGLKD